MTGLLLVNKPLHWSSMDVIRRVRKLTGIKKVGHAGTLDPLATGLLLVCIGRESTKKIDLLMGLEKEYRTTIDLTSFSTTDDAEGEKTVISIATPPTHAQVVQVLQKFIGTIRQVPPRYSAIHINGQRAYKMARRDEDFELEARTVLIHAINLLDYTWPQLTLDITCGKGTYIRSLGRDIGKQLGTGGHLIKLERTAIGQYSVDHAVKIESITTITPDMLQDTV